VLAGGGLAISGTVMQGIFRNPLAEPGILGVSAGASLGALIAISSGTAAFFILPFYAFLGAMLAVGVILTVAMLSGGRAGTLTLIMSGMAVGSLFGALTSLTLTAASQYQVSSYIFWTMGGLANRRWEHVLAILPLVAVTILIITIKARDLDILLLGDEEARALGVPPRATRTLMILLASVCTAAIVSMTGPIGFVGLIIPHIMRLLVGPSHRVLTVASAFGGAIFLVLCDLFTRLLAWPTGAELSVGIVTALVGAPYFLYLLFKSSRRGGLLT
jgi:iron complex transport system permease protein